MTSLPHDPRPPKGSGPLYRSVECRLWDDERFCALSAPPANAQTLWLYMLTGRSTGAVPGLCVFSIAEVAERFDWQIDAVRACVAEVVDSGMARYDAKTRLLWLPKALARRCNMPASPNVVRSWRRAWTELPECALKTEACASILATLGAVGPAFADAFRESLVERIAEALSKGSENLSRISRQQTATAEREQTDPLRSRPPTKSIPAGSVSPRENGHTPRSRAREPTAASAGNLAPLMSSTLKKASTR